MAPKIAPLLGAIDSAMENAHIQPRPVIFEARYFKVYCNSAHYGAA